MDLPAPPERPGYGLARWQYRSGPFGSSIEARVFRRSKQTGPVLLVCSSGGHLLQLLELRPAWEEFPRVWVTFDKSDSGSLLAGERVIHAHGPTNRNVPNLLRNLALARRVIRRERPARAS